MEFIFSKMKKKMWAGIPVLLFLSALLIQIQTGCDLDWDMRVGVKNHPQLPPDGCAGQFYFFDLNNYFCLANFKKPVTFSLSPGKGILPPGISLDKNSRIIFGTPNNTGMWKFNIRVLDGSSAVIEQEEFIIKIKDLNIVTASSLPHICLHSPYSTVIHICGGTPPFKWQIKSGSWSPEAQPLYFSNNQTTVRYNTISGTPNKCTGCNPSWPWNLFKFTVRVTDKNYKQVEKEFNMDVTLELTILNPYKLPTGYVGKPYTYNLSACGGNPPYVWKKTAGSLPAGLFLSADGKIDGGSPTTPGNYAFKVAVTDKVPFDSILEGSFNIRVVNAPLKPSDRNFAMSECTLVNTQIGGATWVSGGYGPRYWKLESGTMPPGLTLTSAGYLKGQPATPGTFNFEVSVHDATTNPGSAPTAKVMVKVNPYPADTAKIVVERFRQLNYGTTGYKENEIDLSLSQKVRVDFRITDTNWEKNWNSLPANMKQVTLKIFGICSADKKNAVVLSYGNADGDPALEHIASFDLNDFKTLINAAGGTVKSLFNFRIIVQKLESNKKLLKTFKNVKVK